MPSTNRLDRRAGLQASRPLLVVWMAGLAVLVASLGMSDVSDRELLVDPSYFAGLPWYTGFISHLGIIAWTLAAGAAAGAAYVARLGGRDRAAYFLMQSAALATLLALDDILRLHSSVFPRMFGVSKTTVYGVYALLALAWLIGNRTEIIRTRWGLLAAAAVAFGASVVIDQLYESRSWGLVAEDGAKFLGALAWATYFTMTTRDIASSVVRELRERAAAASPTLRWIDELVEN